VKEDPIFTFDNFDHEPGTEDTYRAFRQMATGKYFSFLLSYGGVGNGKSHLLEALAYSLRESGKKAKVIIFSMLLSSLAFSASCDRRRSNEGKPWIPLEDRLNGYSRMPYLLIDDYGMGNVKTGWEADRDAGWFERIIVARYRAALEGDRLYTVMTTNLDLDKIPERIVSRFDDAIVGKMVANDGDDYRPKKK